MTRSRRAALALAAGLTGSMLLATSSWAAEPGSARTTVDQPTHAQIAAAGFALPFGSRKVKVRTTDGVDAERISRGDACPEGDAKRAQYGFSGTWRVLVRVCLVKVSKVGRLRRTRFSSCSRWS
jgi:hypothetical protein